MKFTHHWDKKMIPFPIGGIIDNAVSFTGANVDKRREENEETCSLFRGKTDCRRGASRKDKSTEWGETETIELLSTWQSGLVSTVSSTKCLQSMKFLPIRITF